jgi:hypothetical protein
LDEGQVRLPDGIRVGHDTRRLSTGVDDGRAGRTR